MEFDWVMVCGLGWFMGPHLRWVGLGWVSRLLGWVEEIGPTDNSEDAASVSWLVAMIIGFRDSASG